VINEFFIFDEWWVFFISLTEVLLSLCSRSTTTIPPTTGPQHPTRHHSTDVAKEEEIPITYTTTTSISFRDWIWDCRFLNCTTTYSTTTLLVGFAHHGIELCRVSYYYDHLQNHEKNDIPWDHLATTATSSIWFERIQYIPNPNQQVQCISYCMNTRGWDVAFVM
jgi:hypothetical protein